MTVYQPGAIGPLEVKMKKKTLLLGALLLVVLAVEGCATLRGMGEDIQNLGRALKRGSLRIGRDSDGMLAKFLEGGCTSFVRSLEAASLPVL